MMQIILAKMQPMDFKVTREAAQFAAEAYIHHMCTVVNLIKTCCFEGAAYDCQPAPAGAFAFAFAFALAFAFPFAFAFAFAFTAGKVWGIGIVTLRLDPSRI
jgi:hypothetical protein